MKYFDYAKNMTNAAVASAVAKCRREAKAEGNAYTVIFGWKAPEEAYWTGNHRHAIDLAQDIAFNGGYVKIVRPNGKDVTGAENIMALRY